TPSFPCAAAEASAPAPSLNECKPTNFCIAPISESGISVTSGIWARAYRAEIPDSGLLA
ncbi:MAG: hypothetical protein ACI8V4_002256, partial [Ilumatobacter sp.]